MVRVNTHAHDPEYEASVRLGIARAEQDTQQVSSKVLASMTMQEGSKANNMKQKKGNQRQKKGQGLIQDVGIVLKKLFQETLPRSIFNQTEDGNCSEKCRPGTLIVVCGSAFLMEEALDFTLKQNTTYH